MDRIFIPLLIVFALDFYFFQAIKTIGSEWEPLHKSILYYSYWGISVLCVGILLTVTFLPKFPLPEVVKHYAASVVLVIVFAKIVGSLFLLVEDLYRGFSFLATSFSSEKTFDPSRKNFLSKGALILAALPFSSMIYGMIRGGFNYQIRRVTLNLKNLPAAFDGMKLLQISDLHTGSFAFKEPLERAVGMINEEAPDMIFFTGDLVNNKADEAFPFRDTLSKITAPRGVYSVVGNHDYGDYIHWMTPEAKEENFKTLMNYHKEVGWNLLMNENVVLEEGGDKLAIIGVENWGASLRFPRKGDLVKAKRGTEDAPVKLLLSHDPSHWDAQILKDHPDIDVTFSGHTHGFQFGIEIPGFKWSPVQYVYKQWAGLYEKGMQKLYVNRGLGFLGYLGRVGISPEITVFELKKEKTA